MEAAIAAEHAGAASVEETDWDTIVALYDRLMGLAPSPVVALNRAIAIGERDGAERGLEELEYIVDAVRLARYPFHRAAMGELELRRGRPAAARSISRRRSASPGTRPSAASSSDGLSECRQ